MDDQEARACPTCHEDAVVFDHIQGVSACESCGCVVQESELVAPSFDGVDGRPSGVFVGAKDTGAGASAALLHGSGIGRAIQRSRPNEGITKVRQVLRDLSARLALPPPIRDQAAHFLEQLFPLVAGNWRREHVAAAAVYTAIRINRAPLTLVDLSEALQTNIYVLGTKYRAGLRLLGVHPPQAHAVDLVERSVEALLAGERSAAGVRRDTELALAWMERHLLGRHHPLIALCAAILIACEMNSVSEVFALTWLPTAACGVA